MKQNKVLLSRMEKEVYSRKQTLLMLLNKICEHCLTPSREENTTEEVKKSMYTTFFKIVTHQITILLFKYLSTNKVIEIIIAKFNIQNIGDRYCQAFRREGLIFGKEDFNCTTIL